MVLLLFCSNKVQYNAHFNVPDWMLNKIYYLCWSWQKRYTNRPIIEFEIAAQEQMKITELRLAKLFSAKVKASSATFQYSATAKTAEGTLLPSIQQDF